MSREFNVKHYVPLAIKEEIAETVANAYFSKNINGEVIDYSEIDKTRALVYFLFKSYTDLEIPQLEREQHETEEAFTERVCEYESNFIDELMEDLSYDILLNTLCKTAEYEMITRAINSKIEFKKKKIDDDNNFGKTILKLIQSFLDKAPDSAEMSKTLEELKNMDLDKYQNVMELKKIVS